MKAGDRNASKGFDGCSSDSSPPTGGRTVTTVGLRLAARMTLAGAVAFGATLVPSSPSVRLVNAANSASGTDAARSCGAAGVGASYGTSYRNGVGYTVSSVTLAGLDTDACTAATVTVVLTDNTGTPLGEGAVRLASPASEVTVTIPAAPPAASVAGTSVAISGVAEAPQALGVTGT